MKVRIPFAGLFTKPFRFFTSIKKTVSSQVKQSLRLQLILTFGVCLVLSIFVAGIANDALKGTSRYASIDYASSLHDIDNETRNVADQINENPAILQREADLLSLLDEPTKQNNMRMLLVDVTGKVLYKSKNSHEDQIDLYNIIRNAMDIRNGRYAKNKGGEFYSFYPVNLNGVNGYVVAIAVPEPRIIYRNNENNSAFGFLAGLAFFMFLFYFLTKRKMKYIEELAQGLLEISKGDLNFRVVKRSADELGSLSDNINFMAEELKNKIERERQAEKTKNELITNISHDLRTPLTSIMGYLKLINDKRYVDERELEEYAGIAYGKAEKLKVLIEDLFEYTKLSNEGVRLNTSSVNINELLEQLLEEMVPLFEENSLTVVHKIPREKVEVFVDAEKMVRVFENLLMNAIKYSNKPGEIRVEMVEKEQNVTVIVQNQGESIPKQDLPKLFQRFYRQEKSRTSTSCGSGLGLAITQSIVELHGGKIWAECEGNTIRFFVSLVK